MDLLQHLRSYLNELREEQSDLLATKFRSDSSEALKNGSIISNLVEQIIKADDNPFRNPEEVYSYLDQIASQKARTIR